jgi:hypothetical protein
MVKKHDEEKDLCCSFCGKNQNEVKKLIEIEEPDAFAKKAPKKVAAKKTTAKKTTAKKTVKK